MKLSKSMEFKRMINGYAFNRDGAYLNKFIKNKDWSYHDYRNFPIKDLKKPFFIFIKNDYFVIRVGSISEGKLNISDKKYIDYSNSDIKSNLWIVFYYQNVKCFGGSSGMVYCRHHLEDHIS